MKILKKISAIALATVLTISATSSVDALGSIKVIMGQDRYETASKIAGYQGNYRTAVLVNSTKGLSDGLSASGLAGVLDAPILLTTKDSIPNETQLRLEICNKIYIVGSYNSVSKSVENNLKSSGFEVIRIAGDSREDTSYKVAKKIVDLKGSIGKVFVVNGYNRGEADAMSATAVASRDGIPILLTDGRNLPSEMSSIIFKSNRVYVVGGVNTLSNTLANSLDATRLSGADRYETNQAVVNKFYSDANEFYLSDGYKLVDALTGGPLAAGEISPIVLVSKNSRKDILSGANKIVAFGGIPQDTLNRCLNAANQ